MSDAPRSPRGGLPPGVTVGESWPAMVAELEHDQARNRIDSDARRLVEHLVDPATFTEVGRLVGLAPDGSSARVPGEVVAGWGEHHGRMLFVAADEVLATSVPRNPAGTTMAGNVQLEAFRRGSPYVSVLEAPRLRADTWDAAAFTRVGLQFDLELERRSWQTIPKIVVLRGGLDRVALLEASFAHYVVAQQDSRVALPDGRILDAKDMATLGWVDVLCGSLDAIVAVVERVLAVVPDNVWSPAADQPAQRPAGNAAAPRDGVATAFDWLVDGGTDVRLSGGAPGAAVAGLARLAGMAVAVVDGTIDGEHDRQRVAKARLISALFGLPFVLIDRTPEWTLVNALAEECARHPRPPGADVPLLVCIVERELSAGTVRIPADMPCYPVMMPPTDVRDTTATRDDTAHLLRAVRTSAQRRRRPPLEATRWADVERTGPSA